MTTPSEEQRVPAADPGPGATAEPGFGVEAEDRDRADREAQDPSTAGAGIEEELDRRDREDPPFRPPTGPALGSAAT